MLHRKKRFSRVPSTLMVLTAGWVIWLAFDPHAGEKGERVDVVESGGLHQRADIAHVWPPPSLPANRWFLPETEARPASR
jgi:hypothetical protein